jgi:hypothetical protein
MMRPVSLTDGWIATPTWKSPQGFISTIRLENKDSGEIIERTRFDSGKLLFLDRKEEFPSFDRAVLLHLAKSLSDG